MSSILDPQLFYGVPWRSLITDLDGVSLTILDGRASGRTVEFAVNRPAVAKGDVYSDDPAVNLDGPDGDPYLSFNNRQLILFRRENAAPPYWVPRFGGIIMPLQDEARDANATSSYTAFDPRQVLYSRPVVNDSGDLPGPNGWTITGLRGDEIVVKLLENQLIYCSDGAHPEAFLDWGQTAFYTGTIEATDTVVAINFQQGASVGDAIDQLAAAGYLDLDVAAIYDPVNRPGIIGEVNIFQQQGQQRDDAIFSWDLPPRSLVEVSNLIDGSQLKNKVLLYPGQGGPTVPLQTNVASVAKYGDYLMQSFVTAEGAAAPVTLLALEELALRMKGKQTLSVQPATGHAPVALVEYALGDTVPLWASSRFRAPLGPTADSGGSWIDPQRIYGISMQLPDDEPEVVDRLLLSKDEVA